MVACAHPEPTNERDARGKGGGSAFGNVLCCCGWLEGGWMICWNGVGGCGERSTGRGCDGMRFVTSRLGAETGWGGRFGALVWWGGGMRRCLEAGGY